MHLWCAGRQDRGRPDWPPSMLYARSFATRASQLAGTGFSRLHPLPWLLQVLHAAHMSTYNPCTGWACRLPGPNQGPAEGRPPRSPSPREAWRATGCWLVPPSFDPLGLLQV